MHFPDRFHRPGFIYATAPLRIGVIEKEEALVWMIIAASMRSLGVESGFIALAVPSLLLYVYKRLTAGNAPGTMRFWTILKMGGLYKLPYIGFVFIRLSETTSEQWKKAGSLIPPTYKNHFEP